MRGAERACSVTSQLPAFPGAAGHAGFHQGAWPRKPALSHWWAATRWIVRKSEPEHVGEPFGPSGLGFGVVEGLRIWWL